VGATRAELAELALLSSWHVQRLELGLRRTRPATLERLCIAISGLAEQQGLAMSVEQMLPVLIDVAGNALADDSPNQERILRRAKRRQRRKNVEFMRQARRGS
jgi:hypothetical protein